MSVLLREIKATNRDAARVLEDADLRTDSDIQSLTREDLHELFPGPQKLKLRRTIFDIIHKQKPVDVLIRELIAFIPHDSFRAALTNNGVLVDYLRILKDLKTQMNCVQSFLDSHIGLLEEFSKNQPDRHQESDTGYSSATSTSDTCHRREPYNVQTSGYPRGPQDLLPDTVPSYPSGPLVLYTGATSSPQGSKRGSSTTRFSQEFHEVKYWMLVSGKTFDAHEQLMDKVAKSPSQARLQLQLMERPEDCQVTIVFCPIISRVGSDVEAAMSDVKDDKPVILVLMHHTREPKYSARTCHDAKVVLHVNVFYHETTNGLVKCEENNTSASEIRNKLLEYSVLRHKDTSQNALDVVGCTAARGGGNDKGSDGNGSFFKLPFIFNK